MSALWLVRLVVAAAMIAFPLGISSTPTALLGSHLATVSAETAEIHIPAEIEKQPENEPQPVVLQENELEHAGEHAGEHANEVEHGGGHP